MAVVLAAALSGAGCRSEEPRPEPEPVAAEPAPLPGGAPIGPGAPPPATEAPAAAPAPAGLPETDYWYERFGRYMSPELRRRYLATPPAERFRAFGERLLEFQRRDALLEPYRERLGPADLERYHALPDVGSSERFLRQRFPER